jgi:hypothetical protein
VRYETKIVLHSKSGYRPEIDALIESFIRDGVKFVGVVGDDCEKIEDIIDEIVVGDGNNENFILTSSHPGESLEEAIEFARSLSLEYAGEVQVIEF